MLDNKRFLQVALDTPDLGEALRIASLLSTNIGCENLIIEAGTPLIKSWGGIAVEMLKKTTECIVFADTKTVDVGGLESRIVFDRGADIVSLLGVADNSTIQEAVSEAEKRGKLVAVDLIGVSNTVERTSELIDLGVNIIIYHVGIDVQKKRGITVDKLLDEIKTIIQKTKKKDVKYAVAGGLKPGRVGVFKDIGVDIVIVGSAITKSSDPVDVAKRIINEFV
ncbi:orotidine 5'-phosphate decarboxylase [Desulfurococcaceae archaeon MEX13E-LK6-19]|nr:orotidine 5'-phosphate decarboxylase [Desulfurococcaceae archaeon MEX13E-LK6-19]